MLALCPRTTFLVFHPAWGYFADAFGLTQESIERDGKAPAPGDLARIIDAGRAADVRVVFIQPQTSAAAARTVAEAIGARVVVLDPLRRDWAAAMYEAAEAFREALCD
jgi:zinc transport system substrate-binding protein